MSERAAGGFEIEMRPGVAELDGVAARWDFEKTWSGDLAGISRGVMLSAGDPAAGAAGYVALESFDGTLGDAEGGFVLSHLGRLNGDEQTLDYDVVPGSGTGGLAGLSGRMSLTVEDGDHAYVLDYDLP